MKFCFIIHPNKQKTNVFPLGPAYLGAVLRKKGHDVKMYCMDVFHYTGEDLKGYLERKDFDAVGLGFLAARFDFVDEVCKVIDSLEKRPTFIIGGPGPTPIPEYCLKRTKADIALLGESELILPEVLESLERNKPISRIKGIVYREGDKIKINEREEPVKNIDKIPFPSWDLFPIEKYVDFPFIRGEARDRVLSILSSRGCPYRCNFCYRVEKGVRLRSINNLIEEMKILYDKYKINTFQFQDELVMLSEQRISEMCNLILKEKLDIKFDINGRLNIVNKKILKDLKKAGCVFINYGIEAYDQRVLNLMNKNLTIEQIDKGLDLTVKYGIGAGVNVIFGNLGDNEESLKRGVDLILKYPPYYQCRTIRPVTPYPGSPLYDYAIEKGLLKGPEDFFEKHKNSDAITVNFTELPDEKIYKLLYEANKKLIRAYYDKNAEKVIDGFKRLYFDKDYSFRGAR